MEANVDNAGVALNVRRVVSVGFYVRLDAEHLLYGCIRDRFRVAVCLVE